MDAGSLNPLGTGRPGALSLGWMVDREDIVRWFVACALPLTACAGGADIGGDKSTFGSGGNGGKQDTEGDGVTSGAGPGSDTESDSNSGFATSGGDSTGTDGGSCIDNDGDQFGDGCVAGDDCDDDNVDINPGAMEQCDAVDWNCDGDPATGCECADDGVGSNCNQPFDLGVLTPGGSKMGIVGNVPVENNFDWYQVSFPAEARPGEGMPSISFAINTEEQFVFDVLTDVCGAGGMQCGNAGAPEGLAEGLTDFTFVDDDPGCCTEPMDALVPWPDVVYIRVYRTTAGSSCAAYQLQVSR